ncbi:hypothetical protein R6Q59_015302 [Mikania micrantha]
MVLPLIQPHATHTPVRTLLFGKARRKRSTCVRHQSCLQGGFKNVLVIGGDCLSCYVDRRDRRICVLFGDVAAIVVQACDIEEDGLFGFNLHTDGNGSRHLNAVIKHIETNLALDYDDSALGFSPTHASISSIQTNGQEIFCLVS